MSHVKPNLCRLLPEFCDLHHETNPRSEKEGANVGIKSGVPCGDIVDNSHLRDKLQAGATVRCLFAGIQGLLYATGFVLVWGWVALSVREYVSALTVFLGFGLSLASLSVIPTTLPVAGLVHAFVALLEEPQLERRFGESLIRYKRSVNRWSPRWPPTRASP